MSDEQLSSLELRKALKGKLLGRPALYFKTLTSTMDETAKRGESGADEGLVIVAEEQTKGRGRFQRQWVSPPGANLYFSILLRPKAQEIRYMNMAATVAVVRAIRKATGLSPTVKWPNDVRLNGKKVCGILIEGYMVGEPKGYAVVGIGLNVNFDTSQYPELAIIATSISQEAGKELSRLDLLRSILEEMEALYLALLRGEYPKSEWAGLLETIGQDVQVRWGDTIVEGHAEAVDEDGNLIIRRKDGSTVSMMAGEVTLQR